MSFAFIVFPHQLFELHLNAPSGSRFFLLEDPLYFSQYKFHKQKLILHRASMKCFEGRLQEKGCEVHYWDFNRLESYNDLVAQLIKQEIRAIKYYNTTDDWLEQKILREFSGFQLQRLETPMFLSSEEFLKNQFEGKKHFSMASFYIEQRKRLSILVENKKPIGGKWSFDSDNRKKLPKSVSPPIVWSPLSNQFVSEAKEYINQHFPENPGQVENFQFAVTHQDAKQCLEDFLQNRFIFFGPYEDAISTAQTHIFHSILTPYLNTGLLTPETVVKEVLAFAETNDIPLNSLEGFLRQIIGWREFMLGVYLYKGRRERTVNFWDHKRKLPYSFWEGNTGIAPLDMVIKRVITNAYTHHIERLMVMGNFMFLCEIDPDEIYKWFMEMYIDAYDWVMVPNVYSMSQYAGGGTSTTKPYFSGSNYILKMSDIKPGEWCEVWDGLYWRFIHKYKEFFQGNPRLSTMTIHLRNMSKEKLDKHISVAEAFLEKLDNAFKK
ncbi:MAG: cryptochrome/photolyase family protein [Opitutaceae bacterium]|nr:cryptochrome/photolyase family protein [Cytophagales bacterium]